MEKTKYYYSNSQLQTLRIALKKAQNSYLISDKVCVYFDLKLKDYALCFKKDILYTGFYNILERLLWREIVC